MTHPEQQQAAAAEAQRGLGIGSYWGLAGFPAAAIGLWLAIIARRRGEARWTIVPFLLLIAYGLSLGLMV